MSGTLTTSSSTSSLKVLSEESLHILRVRGNDTTVRSGFHTVLNTSYCSESSVDSQATVYIPEELESIETLQFLEFVPGAASAIWNSLLQRRQNDLTVLTFSMRQRNTSQLARMQYGLMMTGSAPWKPWDLQSLFKLVLWIPTLMTCASLRLSKTPCTTCSTCDTNSYPILTMT